MLYYVIYMLSVMFCYVYVYPVNICSICIIIYNVICEKKNLFKLMRYMWNKLQNFLIITEPKLKVFIEILLELSDAGADFTDIDLRDEVNAIIITVNNLM